MASDIVGVKQKMQHFTTKCCICLLYTSIKGLNVNDKNGTAGTYAIDAISDAISKVSSQRSSLGAVQNRLEHTLNNLRCV